MDAPLGRHATIPLEASPSAAAVTGAVAAGAAEEKPPKDKKAKQERKRREAAELIASSATSEAMQRVLGNSDLVALIIQALVVDVAEFNRLKAVSKIFARCVRRFLRSKRATSVWAISFAKRFPTDVGANDGLSWRARYIDIARSELTRPKGGQCKLCKRWMTYGSAQHSAPCLYHPGPVVRSSLESSRPSWRSVETFQCCNKHVERRMGRRREREPPGCTTGVHQLVE